MSYTFENKMQSGLIGENFPLFNPTTLWKKKETLTSTTISDVA